MVLDYLIGKGLEFLWDGVKSLTSQGLDKVADKVKDATGIDIRDKEQVDNLTPEDKLKLKQWAIEHEEFLADMQYKYAKLDADDRVNARDMQKAALAQSDRVAKRFVYIFGGVTTLIALVYVFCVTFCPIPETGVRMADTSLGFLLGTLVAQIFNFFFGSSASSRRKDEARDLANSTTTGR